MLLVNIEPRTASLVRTMVPCKNGLLPAFDTATNQHTVLLTPLMISTVSAHHDIAVANLATPVADLRMTRTELSTNANLAILKKAGIAILARKEAKSWIHLRKHVSLKVRFRLCLFISKVVNVIHEISWKKRENRTCEDCGLHDACCLLLVVCLPIGLNLESWFSTIFCS